MGRTYREGDALTLDVTVRHVVDLGGGVTNYQVELPSGHTAWLRSYQLPEPFVGEVKGEPDDDGAKSVPAPEETKNVPAPPAKKATRRSARAKAAVEVS